MLKDARNTSDRQPRPVILTEHELPHVDFDALDLSSLAAFAEEFPIHGDEIYQQLFRLHNDTIQTQKGHVAAVNLQKIFEATFAISAASGFDRMSLRDLSRRAELSLGAIYSCITKKEDIVAMVATVVELSTQMTGNYGLSHKDVRLQISNTLRFHMYASTLLQPWYFFLYFETRGLPKEGQLRSKGIEVATTQFFENALRKGVQTEQWEATDTFMAANVIVTMLEDWYLKPWKYQTSGDIDADIDRYHRLLTDFIFRAVK